MNRAFASRAVLKAALTATDRFGFVGHELGDVWLVWQPSARAASATFAA